MSEEPTLTPRQLARRLRVSPSTIRKWVERDGLPAIRPSRRTIRFVPSQVEAWLRDRTSANKGGRRL